MIHGPITGDGTRVSFRGKGITMCGVKQADARLPSQKDTGKTMNQSSGMYTPAVAGFVDEAELMPYFHRLVNEFLEVERQQYCVVNGKKYCVGEKKTKARKIKLRRTKKRNYIL